jgi:DNA repair exonuclease SbcCD ATPase subunit
MGNNESLVDIDPEILSSTQLVGSYIQKRSSLNYQINQLKLALNTKKTCIETKKLRDLKAKNSSLVVEIKNSEKLLEKIRQKKYIKYRDKDLSMYVSHFLSFLQKKRKIFLSVSEELDEESKNFEKQSNYMNDRQAYLNHLNEKSEKLTEKLKKNSHLYSKLKETSSVVDELKSKFNVSQEKRKEISEKHSKLAARRRLKRRQTLFIPKLPTNAVMLRSKLLLKLELKKQINELMADQSLHIQQQNEVREELEQEALKTEDREVLENLTSSKKVLQSKIFKYRSELELFSSSPIPPSPILKDIEDSLHTDMDMSSDSEDV